MIDIFIEICMNSEKEKNTICATFAFPLKILYKILFIGRIKIYGHIKSL